MRALVIDDRTRAAVRRVLDYASKPENLYVVEKDGRSRQLPPGDNWRHVARLSTCRCVFSYTLEVASGRAWRHLSISVPSDKYPHPAAVSGNRQLQRPQRDSKSFGMCSLA